MLLIHCPYCRMDRPEPEFRYAGEAHIARPADPAALDDAQWAEFLHMRSNRRGVHAERWRHTHGCGRFFNCLRDTVSDRILATYRAGAPPAAAMTQAFRMRQIGPPLRFSFDGRAYVGQAGDTLASALLANGVHLVGRSFKYHRPRGILSAGAEEPNALVAVSRGPGRVTPNLRATQVELYEGLVATSQNRWPSLAVDVGALAGLAAPLLSAGFYYKTLMGPRGRGWWHRWFEPLVRRAAGLGLPPVAADPDRYAQFHAHCDVLVVGAGPAGIAAALEAGASGARVILCDEGPPDRDAMGEGLSAWERLAALPNVRFLPRTQAFGYYAQNLVGLCERVTDHLAAPDPELPRERLWQVRAGEVVLATGAVERPLVFADNDRPGIMLAEAARQYLRRYGVQVGRRVVVATAHDSAYRAALDLAAAGVQVALIADLRPRAEGSLPDAARAAGLVVRAGASVLGTRGGWRLTAAAIGDADGGREWISCDTLLMSGGWTPSVQLFAQSRGRLVYDDALGAFRPGEAAQRVRCVGACAGDFDPAEAGVPPVVGAVAGKAFVDFQNDVCAADIALAVREGMRSVEHIKRYTTAGMATDQGKTGNMNMLAVAAALLEAPVPAVGHTTFRPPYTPVTFGTLAGAARGALFEPVRTTPLHGWAADHGAIFEDVGQWKRAWYFPRAGDSLHDAVEREVRATRGAVGLFDASTLGKIEVVGPDAAAFLDRITPGAWARLAPGRCRYGVMLTEAGVILDDGVVARLAPDRFHVTTTTGGAARVLAHMEDYLQTEFPELRVWLTSTTEHWAVVAVQGPRARDVLAPLVDDIALATMPHMSVREGRVAGVPARLMRVSFTGELGFEVNVPAGDAVAVWEALWGAAQPLGGVAYGTEAMHVMRAEKGYIIVGQETDGTVTPDDVGLGWTIGRGKGDFVGRRSLALPELRRDDRKQLVGLLTEDPARLLEEGAQVTEGARPATGSAALGHVTSAYMSPTLGRAIALALVQGGRARLGARLHVPMPGGAIPVTVTGPVFHDPQGARLDG